MDGGPFKGATRESEYRTNIRGTFAAAQQAARRLRADGALITFSSSMVVQATPAHGPCAAARERSTH